DGKRRAEPTVRDLGSALSEVLAGKPPRVAETEAFGCPLPAPSLAGAAAQVPYSRDVAPILWKRFARLHRPRPVAPLPRLTYRDAAKRAGFLSEVTSGGRMPPWKPVDGFGEFLDEARLSRPEKLILARWAEQGAPLGDPADLPPQPSFESEDG